MTMKMKSNWDVIIVCGGHGIFIYETQRLGTISSVLLKLPMFHPSGFDADVPFDYNDGHIL